MKAASVATYWPRECLFDLWQVRAFFQKHYNIAPIFWSRNRTEDSSGLLALSWLEESIASPFPGKPGGQDVAERIRCGSDPITYQRSWITSMAGLHGVL